jgi:DNA-binding LytR/AlgR family response regulator
MMRMEEQLFNKGFVRTHKSFQVSKRYIRSIDSARVLLDTGEELPVGKS